VRVTLLMGLFLGGTVFGRAPPDALEPARAALRTLQFERAIALLDSAGRAGSADAQYLLGLMYLNGVGTPRDPARARALLQSAARAGQGASAYVLAAELAHDPDAQADLARQWLQKSAQLGYPRAIEAVRSGKPLLAREPAGASDPVLRSAWILDCARRNDAGELRRLGSDSLAARDEFGRGPLHYAVQAGALGAAQTLLDLGADVQAADHGGVTVLMLASERADSGMLELLLKHGAQSQALDTLHRSALFYAARANRSAVMGRLKAAGAPLEAQDERGYNALDAALAVGAGEAAAALKEEGLRAHRLSPAASPSTAKFDPDHPGDLYRGWPALALALSRGDTAGAKGLLEAGARANASLPEGGSLLHLALDAHALDAIALLVTHGADPTIPDHAGHTPLWLATTRKDQNALRALLDAGVAADTHAASEPTPLLVAVRMGEVETAKMLLDAGANPDTKDSLGHTPLMLAAQGGSVDLTQLLLVHRAQLEVRDRQLRTALWHAAARGSVAQVSALLAAGAHSDVVDSTGLTVLHAAVRTVSAVVEVLPVSPELLNRRSTAGDTPLLIAAATGRTEVVRLLLDRHVDPDTQNAAGDTALIAAARSGYEPICQLLRAAGVNTALRTTGGASAADVAAGRGFTAIAKDLASRTL